MKPWLWLPPKLAHDLAPLAMPVVAALKGGPTPEYKSKTWRHMEFKNPLGIAGGVDKGATTCVHWQKLGAGFVEVGTVTPEPQKANPGQIMGRSMETRSLWNKMGFPNAGAKKMAWKLRTTKAKLDVPLFINIGKNRWTETDEAHQDYIKCIQALKQWADAFVVNISSPNTKNLRALQQHDTLKSFLERILNAKIRNNISQPLLVKLSPDSPIDQIAPVLELCLELGIDGWILTNTTTSRPQSSSFPLEGGLSGAPLASLSKTYLQAAYKFLENKRTHQILISAGGIMSPKDVQERLDMGADLLQVYSALIFEGPLFFQNCIKKLSKRN